MELPAGDIVELLADEVDDHDHEEGDVVELEADDEADEDYVAGYEDEEDMYDCPRLHLNVTFNADDEVFPEDTFPTTPFEYSSDDESIENGINNGKSVISHSDDDEIFLDDVCSDDVCSDDSGDHIVTSSSFCVPDTSSSDDDSSDNEVDSDVLYSDEEHKKNTRRKRESLKKASLDTSESLKKKKKKKNGITIDGKTFADCVEEFKDVDVSSGSDDEEKGGFFLMRSESIWELLNPFPKSVSDRMI